MTGLYHIPKNSDGLPTEAYKTNLTINPCTDYMKTFFSSINRLTHRDHSVGVSVHLSFHQSVSMCCLEHSCLTTERTYIFVMETEQILVLDHTPAAVPV